jgi:hypothetical protein
MAERDKQGKRKRKKGAAFRFTLEIPIDVIVKWDASKTAAFFYGLAQLVELKYENEGVGR